MDTQTTYPRGYNQENDPNVNVRHQHVEGEDDQHHEKNSVLKKVKAKAKKIKDTIKKHGHGHNHDHGHECHEGHVPDDHHLDEEDEDEEDIVEDPGVHGAPIHESAAIESVVTGQPEDLNHPGITCERSKATCQDPPASRESSEAFYPGNYKTKDNDPPNSSVNGPETLVTEQPRVNCGKTTVMVEEPLAPQNTPLPVPSSQNKDANPTKSFVYGEEEYPGPPKVNLQRPKGLEEDPAAAKDIPDAYPTTNYQTKVADPTGKGGEETAIPAILHSLDKMNIYDAQDRGREYNLPSATHPRASELPLSKGSHDQFSPKPTPDLPIETPENPALISGTADTEPRERPRNSDADKPLNQSSYTEKISSATSAIVDKAVSAKNIVASKLVYGDKGQTTANESREGQDTTKRASAIDYGKNMAATVTDKLTPVYEKVAGAGSTVMSKLQGPGTGIAVEVETDVQEQDKGMSMKCYIAEKLRPSEEDRALSEVISDALQNLKEDPEKETRARERKATESEEVERRLGTGDARNERADSGSVNSPTKGAVERLKGAIGSWFGKGQSQGIQQPHGSSYGNAGFQSSAGDRSLQEPGN